MSIAYMNEDLIEQVSGKECNYSCSFNNLLAAYSPTVSFSLFLVFWFLGSRIARLSSLISSKDNLALKSSEYKMPWEHKIKKIED